MPAACLSLSFEAAYSDGGLFGFSLATGADSAGNALKAGAAEVARLAAGDFTDEDVARAKLRAKADVLMQVESLAAVGESLAVGLLETKVKCQCQCLFPLGCHDLARFDHPDDFFIFT